MKNQRIDTYEIVTYYRKLGIDLEYKLKNINYFELIKNSQFGFYSWQPIFPGDKFFYEQLSKYKNNYYEYRLDHKYAANWINKDHLVLDIGCGGGLFLSKLKNEKRFGLEPNKLCHSQLKKEGIEILNNLSELKCKMDTITMFHVLEHVSEPIEFIENILKHLKTGGQLIISVPAMESFIGADSNSILNAPPHHLTKWTLNSLSNVFKNFKLKVDYKEHLDLEDNDYEAYLQYLITNSLYKKNKFDNFIIKIINKIIRMKKTSRSKIPFYIPGHNLIIKGIKL